MPKALALTGITGSRVGMREVLSGRTNIVGSGPNCDLVLKDRLVLPRHAEFLQALERWFVKPLDPGATVFINGQSVTNQGRVQDGDLVTFGSATFRVATTEIAEQAVGSGRGPSDSGVPRLGEYLVRRGIVTQDQLEQAERRQGELQRQGRRISFGDLLYEMGFVSRRQLDQALQDQRSDFFERFRD